MSNGEELIPDVALQTVSHKTVHVLFNRTKLRQAIFTYNGDVLRNID
jgi:hypothetical protein